MMRIIRLLLALVLLTPVAAGGKVITVDLGGLGDFATIQAAVDHAGDGDTVEIWPGAYTGAGKWDIEVRDRPITHGGIDPNDLGVVNATIIDCNDPHLLPGSPCIQAGDPAARTSLRAVDLDGQPRRMDKIVEMGVDEYTASGLAILRPRGGEILTGGMAIEVAWQAPASDISPRLQERSRPRHKALEPP